MHAFGPPPVCAYVVEPNVPGSHTPTSLAYVFANTTRPSGSAYGPSGCPSPSARTSTGFSIISRPFGLSPHHQPAGEVDRLPGHVARLRREQEPDQPRGLVGRRRARE